MSNSLRPHGLYIYSPWNSPGQNTEVGILSLLQGIFPTQGSNPGLPRCRWIIYQLSHKGSQIFYVSSDNKCIKSRINMALYLAKDLEFIRGSGHGKGCNLKVILRYYQAGFLICSIRCREIWLINLLEISLSF